MFYGCFTSLVAEKIRSSERCPPTFPQILWIRQLQCYASLYTRCNNSDANDTIDCWWTVPKYLAQPISLQTYVLHHPLCELVLHRKSLRDTITDN